MRRPPSPLTQILTRELETHEHATTYLTPPTPSAPPPLPSLLPLLSLLYSKLPPELRALVFTHLLTPPPPPQPFILYPPFLFPSLPSPSQNTPHLPFRFTIPSPALPSPTFIRFKNDISTYMTSFFAETPIYTRYRYSPLLPLFLSTPFAASFCIPVHHIRRLHIFLAPPESCEDDYGLEDGEAECGWGDMFPVTGNQRWGMWRGRLEGDFGRLGEVLGGMGNCRVTVWVVEGWDEGGGEGVMEWVGGWAEGVNRGGGRVGVRVYT